MLGQFPADNHIGTHIDESHAEPLNGPSQQEQCHRVGETCGEEARHHGECSHNDGAAGSVLV